MRERAAAVNGDIGITSVRGRGTTITLTVPLLAA
jgi:signal transduction histidine kinase